MKKNKFQFSKLYLAAVMVLTYLPILVVVVFSFNDSKMFVSWEGFSLRWYETLLQDRALIEALRNSLILGFLSCSIAAVIGTLGAVGMARVKFKTRGLIEYLSMIPIMVPEIILGMAFMSFFTLLRLPFGMLTLVIAHVSFSIPYVFMMVKARLSGIDQSLEEAARDLGASPAQSFRDVTLPLIMPAVLSGSMLAFAMSFDDVVISIFINGATVSTLPIKVYTQIKTGVTPEINALCTVILLAVVMVMLLGMGLGRGRKRRTPAQENN